MKSINFISPFDSFANKLLWINKNYLHNDLGILLGNDFLLLNGLFWDDEITFKLSNGNLMEVDTKQKDIDFLSLFIASEALGILLFQRGDLLLHGSAIRINGDSSIIFVGEPGMGKSTTAAALLKLAVKSFLTILWPFVLLMKSLM